MHFTFFIKISCCSSCTGVLVRISACWHPPPLSTFCTLLVRTGLHVDCNWWKTLILTACIEWENYYWMVFQFFKMKLRTWEWDFRIWIIIWRRWSKIEIQALHDRWGSIKERTGIVWPNSRCLKSTHCILRSFHFQICKLRTLDWFIIQPARFLWKPQTAHSKLCFKGSYTAISNGCILCIICDANKRNKMLLSIA
jgi:hypothetical protein